MCETNSGPIATHEKISKNLFRYLYGTKSLSIHLGVKHDYCGPNLRVDADALFADDLAKRFLTACQIVFLGGGPILWRSEKQDYRGNKLDRGRVHKFNSVRNVNNLDQ